jgi:hypothetical protein
LANDATSCQCSCPDPAEGKPWGPQIFDSSTYRDPDKRPNIYSNPLPPWPTLEEIRKVVRDELRKHDGTDG